MNIQLRVHLQIVRVALTSRALLASLAAAPQPAAAAGITFIVNKNTGHGGERFMGQATSTTTDNRRTLSFR